MLTPTWEGYFDFEPRHVGKKGHVLFVDRHVSNIKLSELLGPAADERKRFKKGIAPDFED